MFTDPVEISLKQHVIYNPILLTWINLIISMDE